MLFLRSAFTVSFRSNSTQPPIYSTVSTCRSRKAVYSGEWALLIGHNQKKSFGEVRCLHPGRPNSALDRQRDSQSEEWTMLRR